MAGVGQRSHGPRFDGSLYMDVMKWRVETMGHGQMRHCTAIPCLPHPACRNTVFLARLAQLIIGAVGALSENL